MLALFGFLDQAISTSANPGRFAKSSRPFKSKSVKSYAVEPKNLPGSWL
jgi:hypothetical protein